MNYEARWQELVAEKKQAKLYREPATIQSPQGATIQAEGQSFINFSSNDYLGLANHPKIKKAFHQGVESWGVGSGASHLICGHTQVHAQLEARLAAFTGRAKALVFSTGYMANLGTVSALLDRHSWVAGDKLNHASLVDAAQLSRAHSLRYQHANIEHLNQQLIDLKAASTLSDTAPGLIVTDAVFSMDGDIAPIHQLSKVAKEHSAILMVDDAHGFGVLGKEGAGTLSELNLNDAVPVYMATLGKALGSFGAFVAGSEALIDCLMQRARTYTYTTAMPPALACATLAALDCIEQEPWRRTKVRELACRFQTASTQLGFEVVPSELPIQSLILTETQLAIDFSNALKKFGFWVPAIRPPTVPNNSARLRFTFSAAHEYETVEQLLAKLEILGNQFKL